MGSKSLVSVMRQLLRLVADAGVELHFEPLTTIRVDPLAVDALVLILGPRIPECVQLKTLFLQTLDIRPDALSVASFPVLKGVPDRIGHLRKSLLRGTAKVLDTSVDLFFDAVAAFQAVVEAD